MLVKEVTPARLEAFSDGVIAIIITIMALELKVPHEESFGAIYELRHTFVSYALSFLLVAEYWMNHHLIFHLMKKVDNRILWSNMLLLFCVSLIPFFTAFMGENQISSFSVALYSGCALVCAIAFWNLVEAVSRHFKADGFLSIIRQRSLKKIYIAVGLYALAIGAAFIHPYLGLALNVAPAIMYFLPDTFLEKKR